MMAYPWDVVHFAIWWPAYAIEWMIWFWKWWEHESKKGDRDEMMMRDMMRMMDNM